MHTQTYDKLKSGVSSLHTHTHTHTHTHHTHTHVLVYAHIIFDEMYT